MGYLKRIVCLANSYKRGGRCVAGREINPSGFGAWIRPVSDRESAELSFMEYRYGNFSKPKLLDIVEVAFLKPLPRNHQTENQLIDPTRRWKKVGELPSNALEQLGERPRALWINSGHTMIDGRFNCMSPEEAASQSFSLTLIRPENFVLRVGSRTWDGAAKKTHWGDFAYNGTRHILKVTDPGVLETFEEKEMGDYPMKDVHICVSLTEPFVNDGRCHKLVASILGHPPL